MSVVMRATADAGEEHRTRIMKSPSAAKGVARPARADNDIRAGLSLGVGAEYAFSDDWTARLEAVGYRFGDDKHCFAGTGRTVDFDMAKVRVGLSRRF